MYNPCDGCQYYGSRFIHCAGNSLKPEDAHKCLYKNCMDNVPVDEVYGHFMDRYGNGVALKDPNLVLDHETYARIYMGGKKNE